MDGWMWRDRLMDEWNGWTKKVTYSWTARWMMDKYM